MRFNEFKPILNEAARGLAARRIGDPFISDGNEDMTFAGIDFFPQSGKYEEEELTATIADAEKKYKGIQWLNQSSKTGGFAVASFQTEKGKMKHYGRFFQQIKANHIENLWPNTGIPGYRYAKGSGAKETAGMQPSEVLTTFDNLTPKDIVKQIAKKFGAKHPLTKVAQHVANGGKYPIKIPALEESSFEAFRDYFCELLHPMALMAHNTQGNADEAEALFLPDSSYSECTISFSTSKTEGLSDSILVNPMGQNIKVSSKGKGGGAAASVKNLLDAVKELNNTKLERKHKDTINMIETIVKSGQNDAPSALGILTGMINEKEAGLISRLKDLSKQGLTYKDVLKNKKLLTARLMKLYTSAEPRDPNVANPHAHMVTRLAYAVSDKINNEGKFSKAASEILNNAGLVTVDTKAKATGKEWIIDMFSSKFPGENITGVLLSAQKGYASTRLNGNFTFVILKNNADPTSFKDISPEAAPDKKPAAKKKAKKKLSAASGGTKKKTTSKKGVTQRGKR